MQRNSWITFLIGFIGLPLFAFAVGSTPTTIGYQGFMSFGTTTISTTTPNNVIVSVYNVATGATTSPLYAETTSVIVTNGYFQINIGNGTYSSGPYNDVEKLPFDEQYFIGLEFTGPNISTGGPMNGRSTVDAVAYAYNTYGLIARAADPTCLRLGEIYYNTGSTGLRMCTATSTNTWAAVGSSSNSTSTTIISGSTTINSTSTTVLSSPLTVINSTTTNITSSSATNITAQTLVLNATTTTINSSSTTITGTTTLSNLVVGTLNGIVSAINGVFGSTSTVSIAFGGTGTSTAPAYGYTLVGNANGGFDYVATSTLGTTVQNVYSNSTTTIGGDTTVLNSTTTNITSNATTTLTSNSTVINSTTTNITSSATTTFTSAVTNINSTTTNITSSGTTTFSSPTTVINSSSTTITGTTTLSNLVLGTLTGFLQAVSGVVSATSTISLVNNVFGLLGISFGGTGTSTAPALGQILVGNSGGTYDYVSTSSLFANALATGTIGAFASTSIGASVQNASSTGIFFYHNGSLQQDTANFNYDPVAQKLTVTGGVDPLYLQLKDTSNNGAAYLEFYGGNNAATAAANTGRVRYSTSTQTFEASLNGGAYVPITIQYASTTFSTTTVSNTLSVLGQTFLQNASSSILSVSGRAYFNSSTTFNGIEYLFPSLQGSIGQVLQNNGAGGLAWANVSSGGGGTFSTTSDSLAQYPTTVSQVLMIGQSATTTTGNIMEVLGNVLMRSGLSVYGAVTGNSIIATSSLASLGTLSVSATSTFSTTSAASSTITQANIGSLNVNATTTSTGLFASFAEFLSAVYGNLTAYIANTGTLTATTSASLASTTLQGSSIAGSLTATTSLTVTGTTTSMGLHFADNNANSILWKLYEGSAGIGGLLFDYVGSQARLSATGALWLNSNLNTQTVLSSTTNAITLNASSSVVANSTTTGAHHHGAQVTVGTFNTVTPRQIISANGEVTYDQFNVVGGDGSDFNFDTDFNGASDANDPTITLVKGRTYKIYVNASGHPFEIRVSNGGAAYNSGVTNNATDNGVITFKVPMDAPASIVYQCTAHAGMMGIIKIVDPADTASLIDANGVTRAYANTSGVEISGTFTATTSAVLASTTLNGNTIAGSFTATSTLYVWATSTFATTTATQLSLSDALLLASTTPATTTYALYNNAGTLYWNGVAVGSGGASVFSYDAGSIIAASTTANFFLATSSNSVMVGSSTAVSAAKLSAIGTGTTSSTLSFQTQNSVGSSTLQVKDDGSFVTGNVASVGTSTIWGNISVKGFLEALADIITRNLTATGTLSVMGTSTLSTTTVANALGVGTTTNQYGGLLVNGISLGYTTSGGQNTSNVLVLSPATSTSLLSTTTNAVYAVGGTLYFNGSAVAAGADTTIQIITSSTTLASWVRTVLVNDVAGAGSLIVSLPTPIGNAGKLIEIKKVSTTTNAITIFPNSTSTGQTIDNSPSYTITNFNNAVVIRSDGTNYQVVANTGSGQVGASYMHIDIGNPTTDCPAGTSYCTFTQTPLASFGSDISLSAGNTDRIFLKAGKTYKLTGNMFLENSVNFSDPTVRWVDASDNSLGAAAYNGTSAAGADGISTQVTAIYTPTADTYVRLKKTGASGIVDENSDVFIEVIAGNAAVTGSSVDYVNAKLTADATVGAGAVLPFVTQTGNITNTGGVFNLDAGKTYRLTANVAVFSASLATFQWRDITNSTLIGNVGRSVPTSLSNTIASVAAEAIYTPTTNVTVRLENTTVGSIVFSGSSSAQSSATIAQLGSTATTEYTNSVLTDFPTGGVVMAGTLSEFTNFIQIGQTTSAQTLILPNPTNTNLSRIVYVDNTGTANFTMHDIILGAGQSAAFKWNGTAWKNFGVVGGNVAAEYGEVSGIVDAQTFTTTLKDIQGSTTTLPTAGTWEITYNVFGGNSTGNSVTNVGLYDNSSSVYVTDSGAQVTSSGSGAVADSNMVTNTIRVTTTGPASYKLRGQTGAGTFTVRNNFTTTNAGGESKITYKKISGFVPVSGQSVDYVQARRSANVAVTSGTAIPFDTIDGGNIPMTSGVFTLTAGKTYRLEAGVRILATAANNTLSFKWRDITNNTLIGNAAITRNTLSGSTANSQQGIASAVITPSTNITVRLEALDTETMDAGTSFASITQLGTSAIMSDSILAIGGNSFSTGLVGQTFNIGSLTNNAFNFIGSSTLALYVGTSSNVAIGTSTSIYGGLPTEGLTMNNALVLASSTALSTTTYALYNSNGSLYWNGSAVGLGGLPASSTSLYVAANGNVGIGTSTPGQTLVIGTTTTSALSYNSNNGLLALVGTSSSGTATILSLQNNATGFDVGLSFRSGLNNPSSIRSKASGVTTGLSFVTSPGFTNPEERMTIMGNGNVGIGSTSPNALLTLNNVASSSASNIFLIASTTNTAGTFASTTLFVVNNVGGVGIGTTTNIYGGTLTAGLTLRNALVLASSTALSTSTNALYNVNNTLYWNGSALSTQTLSGLTQSYVYTGSFPSTGTVSTFGTVGVGPRDIVFDAAGNLYTANISSSTVSKITPAGVVTTTFANVGASSTAIAVDSVGNLYTANEVGDSVTKITPSGATTTYAVGDRPINIAVDAFDNVYTVNYNPSTISKISRDGVVTTTFATVGNQPYDLAFGPDGNIYTANYGANSVSRVTPAGAVTTFATVGTQPVSIEFDTSGNLYTANIGSTVSKVTPTGVVSVYGSFNSPVYDIVFDTAGNLYAALYGNFSIGRVSTAGVATNSYASVGSFIWSLGIDVSGNLYSVSESSNLVSKVTGIVPTSAYTTNRGAFSVVGSAASTTNFFTVASTSGANIFTVQNSGGVGIGTNSTNGNTTITGGSLVAGLTLGQTTSGGQNTANVLVLASATSTSLVATSSNALYNVNGSLYFNGAAIGGTSAFTFDASSIISASSTANIFLATSTSKVMIGSSTAVSAAKLAAVGTGTTSATLSFQTQNSVGSSTLQVRDDGSFIAGNVASVGTSTIWGNISVKGFLEALADIITRNITATGTLAVQGTTTLATTTTTFLSVGTTTNAVNIGGSTSSLSVAGSITQSVTGIRVVATTTAGTAPYYTVVDGNSLYTVDQTTNSLYIHDISNPALPVFIASTTVGTSPRSVAVQGNYAYTANVSAASVSVVDISNPATPTVVGTVAGMTSAFHVKVSGKYAYVQAAGSNGTLYIVDISVPTSPKLISSLAHAPSGAGVTINGKYAYTMNNAATDDFSIIDISNPYSPYKVASSTVMGDGAYDSVIEGKYMYATAFSSGGLYIWDISSATNPVVVSFITTGFSGAYRIVKAGDYVYIGASNAVHAINVANPVAPYRVETITTTGGNNLTIAVKGQYLYAAGNSGVMSVIDLTGVNIANARIGSLETSFLTVLGNLVSKGNVLAQALSAGIGGIISQGGLSVTGTTSQSTFAGGVGVGTTTSIYGGALTTGLTLNNALVLASSTALSTTTLALYNNAGTLYWNGSAVGSGASALALNTDGTIANSSTTAVLILASQTSPATTTNALYSQNGSLYFNGSALSQGVLAENGFTELAGQTTISGTLEDVTGGAIPLTAGTWEILYNVQTDHSTGDNSSVHLAITNSADVVVAGSEKTRGGTVTTAQPLSASVIVTVATSEVYKLRMSDGGGGTLSILNTGLHGSTITWKKIAGFVAVSGQSVDYSFVKGADAIGANTNDVILPTQISGNIPYDTATGIWTLTAGKTYRLDYIPELTNIQDGEQYDVSWVDGSGAANTGSPIITDATMSFYSVQQTGQFGAGAVLSIVYTPTTNQQVKLRITNAPATGSNITSNSSASIVQLGTSAITSESIVAVGGNTLSSTGGTLSIGTLNNNALAFLSSTTEIMRLTQTGGVGIGTSTNRFGGALTTGLTLNNALVLASSTALSTTSLALYNNNGALYWNGSAVGGLPASTTSLYVAADGKVGIGTTTPTSLLEVYSSDAATYSTSTISSSALRIINADGTLNNSSDLVLASINTSSGNIINGVRLSAIYKTHSSGINADLAILNRRGGLTFETARFTSEGTFLVGTTTSNSSFNLQAISTSSPIFTLASSSGQTKLSLTADGILILASTSLAALPTYTSGGTSVTPRLQLYSNGNQTGSGNGLSLLSYYSAGGSTVAGAPGVIVSRTNSGTFGVYAALASGQMLGSFSFGGTESASAAVTESAAIRAEATQAWAASTHGTALTFYTSANSTAGAPVERMRISQDGAIGIGTTTNANGGALTGGITLGYVASTTVGNIANTLVLSSATGTQVIATSTNALYNVAGTLYWNGGNVLSQSPYATNTALVISRSISSNITASIGSSTNASFTNFSGGIGTGGDVDSNSGNNRQTLRITNTGNLVNIGNVQAGSLSINNATGFTSSGSINDGAAGPRQIATGDMNGDGHLDLVYDRGGNIRIALGNGDGTFDAAVSVTSDGFHSSTGLALFDLNGDGKTDIVLTHTISGGGKRMSVLINNGNLGFTETSYGGAMGGGSVWQPGVADFNSDGKPDVAFVNSTVNMLSVYLNIGDGKFASTSRRDYATGANPVDVAVADLNGDGKADIMTTSGSGIRPHLNNGDGTFTAGADYITGVTTAGHVTLGDVNGDGVTDAVASPNASNANYYVFIGRGNGTFGTASSYAIGGTDPQQPYLTDVDGDGDLDLLAVSYTGSNVRFLRNDGAGSFSSVATYSTNITNPSRLAVGDFNGDGRPDFVTDNNTGNVLAIYLGTANPTLYTDAVNSYVGIGTNAPAYALDVLAVGTGIIARFNSANTTGCTLATGGTISCSSDARLKNSVASTTLGSLATLMKLNPVSFHWNFEATSSTSTLSHGFIAQEVEAVIPDAVMTDETTGYKSLSQITLIPYIVGGIKEQQALLGTFSATGTPGLTDITATVESASPTATVASRLTAAVNAGASVLTNFIATKISAIVGYFDKLFTRELCLVKASGQEVCLTPEELESIKSRSDLEPGNGSNSPSGGGTPGGGSENTDTTAPIISLGGAALAGDAEVTSTLSVGDVYSDLAGVTDNSGVTPDLYVSVNGSASIKTAQITSAMVDTSLPGTYTLVYSATDAAGNAATTKTRTINVEIAGVTPPVEPPPAEEPPVEEPPAEEPPVEAPPAEEPPAETP